MSPAKSKASEHFSSSLARGLSVIKAFDREAPMLRIADVAERTGLDRATARRFLLTLLDLGYVGRSDDLFYLRPSALDIGFSYLASLDVNRVIQPYLNELTAVTRETSSFGILDGLDIRLLARSANNRMMNMTVPLGTRVSAHSASIGRVLLAGLSTDRFEAYLAAMPASDVNAGQFRGLIDEVRSSGWATIEKSPGVGFCSIAVPVRDRDGGTIGGVNVVEYPPRNTPQAMVRKYLKLLRNAAEQIEAALHVSQHAVLALSDDTGGPPLIG